MTIEEETIDQVDQVTRAVINELLGKQADAAPPPRGCPKCGGRLCEKPPQGRSLQSKRGRVHFKTDVYRCEACRLDFFPQMRILRCDIDSEQTPAVLKKIVIAAARDRSYATASRNLEDLADLKISAKQCQRIAIRIGTERIDKQAERIEAYSTASVPDQQHGQSNDAPANDWNRRIAAVQCDGALGLAA